MNITHKSLVDTVDYIVETCFRSICEKKLESVSFRQSVCDLHISNLQGIRLLLIDFPVSLKVVDKGISEIHIFRSGLADVGRSLTQSAEAVE